MTSCRTGKYHYFVCYGYLKGTCSCGTRLSQPIIQEAVLASIKETLGQTSLVFSYQAPKTSVTLDERSHLEDALKHLALKEKRIQEAYRNGVDTLEEYREQKEQFSQERQFLLSRITQLNQKQETPPKVSQSPQILSGIYELLCSEAPLDLKGLVLRAAVEKMVYRKEDDTLWVYYHSAKEPPA